MKGTRRHLAHLVLLLPAVLLPTAAHASGLTFEDRVAAQEAIERVYYAHQVGATQPFEEAAPRAVFEEKVRTYLKKSVALEDVWHTKITGEMLRSEVERMARETRMPERLREIFAALHGDPVVGEECLARPILVSRLVRERFAFDQSLHESARLEAEDLRMELKSGRLGVTDAEDHRTVIEFVRKQTGAAKSESRFDAPAATPDAAGEAFAVSRVETVESSPGEFASQRAMAPARAGEVGEIVEESEAFVIRTVLEERADRFREATYRFPKVSWDAWSIGEKDRFDENGVEAVSVGASPLPNPVGDSVGTVERRAADTTPSQIRGPAPRRSTHRRLGWTSMCNAIDDDCNGTVDAFATACGFGPCHSTGSCVMGVDDCTPGPSSPEACNGIDDDCDGGLPAIEADVDHDGVATCTGDCDDSRSAPRAHAPPAG